MEQQYFANLIEVKDEKLDEQLDLKNVVKEEHTEKGYIRTSVNDSRCNSNEKLEPQHYKKVKSEPLEEKIETNKDETLQNLEYSLTSELFIKSEKEDIIDEQIPSQSYPGDVGNGSGNRFLNTVFNLNEKESLKGCTVYRIFYCKICKYVTTVEDDWKVHCLRHKKVCSGLGSIDDQIKESLPKCNQPTTIEKELPLEKIRISKKNQHFCVFCHIPVINFARHLLRAHAQEKEIQNIFSLPQQSRERKRLLTLIRKKGDYISTLDNPVPVKRSADVKKRLPCSSCLGFYSAKSLGRHRRNCGGVPPNNIRHQVLAQNFLVKDLNVDPDLTEKVFGRMNPDEVSLVAKSDPIICEYAADFLKKIENYNVNNVYQRTSIRMRELAKLLIHVRGLEPSVKKMFDLLRKANYSVIVSAIKSISNYSRQMGRNLPVMVHNLTASLKHCCDIAIKTLAKGEIMPSLALATELENDISSLKELLHVKLKIDVIVLAKIDSEIAKGKPLLWNVEQENVMRIYFETKFKNHVPPKKEVCLKLKELHPDLFKDKAWSEIRVFAMCLHWKFKTNCKNYLTQNYGNKWKPRTLVHWTDEQKNVTKSFFKEHINAGTPPRKRECERLMHLHKELFRNKTWEKIKVYIQNEYKKSSKVLSSLKESRENQSSFDKIVIEDNVEVLPHVRCENGNQTISDNISIVTAGAQTDFAITEQIDKCRSNESTLDNSAADVPDENLEELKTEFITADDTTYSKSSKVIPDNIAVNTDIPDVRMDKLEINRSELGMKKKKAKKTHLCYFCNTRTTHYARHLVRSHRTQVDIKQFFCTSIRDPKTKVVLTKFKGTKRRLAKKLSRKRHRQCNKTQILLPEARIEETHEGSLTPTDSLFENANFYSSLSINDILNTMRLDQAAEVGRCDMLICGYADKIFSKTNAQTVRDIVCNAVRELGRLLVQLRNMIGIKNLIEALKPEFFDILLDATKTISGYDPEVKAFKTSYLPLKMGRVLKEVCKTAIEIMSKDNNFFGVNKNEVTLKSLNRLVTLIEHHWSSDLMVLQAGLVEDNEENFKVSCDESQCLLSNKTKDGIGNETAYKHTLKCSRRKFTEEEKQTMRSFFTEHIKNKQSPKKLEVLKFMKDHATLFKTKNWIKLKAFIYNEYRAR